MKTYGFGIVGCGSISDFHAAAIKEIPNAKLVAVMDIVDAKRKALMEKHNCEGTSSLDELINRKDIDIICVCTPSGAHLEPSLAAAKAGKHLVVEKPIEVTLERADQLIKVCEDNHVQLCAIFPMRFGQVFQVLKAAVDEGRFGRLTVGDCFNKAWRSQEYYDSAGWRGTWKLDGGGACMNQGIHAIDIVQWLMGPVASITAFAGCLVHERIEVEDTAVAAVQYKNGALGTIECTTSVFPGSARRIEIHGDRGTAVVVDMDLVEWTFADERPDDDAIRKQFAPGTSMAKVGTSDPRAMTHEKHRVQLQDFVDSLETGRKPRVDGAQGRKAIEIITAIYRSAKEGRTMQLPL